MKKLTNKKRKAFTLAEVLITLGIIGIVAQMTIPTLIQSTQQQATKVGIKEAYSILSQATLSASTDNGGTLTNLWAALFDNVGLKNVMVKYLKVIKDCGGAGGGNSTNNPVTNGCWVTTKMLDGTTNNEFENYAGVVLANGMFATFRALDVNCASYNDARGVANCGWIIVDINGSKKPNQVGKDSFIFYLYPNGDIKPYDDGANNCTGVGYNCIYSYIYN